MKLIGLIGGIASGKSRVAQMLVELGAGLLDADRAGHAVLASDSEVHAALRERWGNAVFAENGTVNRSIIAKKVFGSAASADLERGFLEHLMHPRIWARLQADIKKQVAAGRQAVVLDAPLLLEAGWKPLCDVVLFVDASRDTRLRRAMTRGWTEAEFDLREQAQAPIAEKRAAADYVINNDASEDELRRAVEMFWKTHLAARPDS